MKCYGQTDKKEMDRQTDGRSAFLQLCGERLIRGKKKAS